MTEDGDTCKRPTLIGAHDLLNIVLHVLGIEKKVLVFRPSDDDFTLATRWPSLVLRWEEAFPARYQTLNEPLEPL